MKIRVENAIIMAAGKSSRFAPISEEVPKALLTVKGEVLIERQIRQLREAGIWDIIIVVGYKREMFWYLEMKYDVVVLTNEEYLYRNNHSTLYRARAYLGNTYICSADNYFTVNPFKMFESEAYYSALYSEGETKEWCITTDDTGRITEVQVGGKDSWYMIGHVFFDEKFSSKFLQILEKEYNLPGTEDKLWENIYLEHIDELDMKIKKYRDGDILEFDNIEELKAFDRAYEMHPWRELQIRLGGTYIC